MELQEAMSDIVYEYVRNEDGALRECDSCHYPARLSLFKGMHTDYPHEPTKDVHLCEVCASTFISNATVCFPSQHSEHDLYKSLGWIANKLLDEIRDLKPSTAYTGKR